MRNPRPDAFDPKAKKRHPDAVNLTGVVALVTKEPRTQNIYNAAPQSKAELVGGSVAPRYHGITTPPTKTTPLPLTQEELMKTVRKAVKAFGKEAATYRFTPTEKQALAEIIYAYRNQGIRTSENEITRIAINYLFYEYKLEGQNSILHQSLVSLKE